MPAEEERSGRRLPNHAHTERPWRIHELVADFRLEDVWRLPGAGGPDDFPKLIAMLARLDPARSSSAAVRMLFAVRERLGERFGWDRPEEGLEGRVPSLRERLPADLRDGPTGPGLEGAPFRALYLLDDEWAAEIANRTVHGVIHVGRVPLPDGGFHAQLAIYAKPNGVLGKAYMAAIKPFRYAIVYPVLLREGARAWREASQGSAGGPGW